MLGAGWKAYFPRGVGEPEALVGRFSGFWSRRMTLADRLVYLPKDGLIYVIACRFHYDD